MISWIAKQFYFIRSQNKSTPLDFSMIQSWEVFENHYADDEVKRQAARIALFEMSGLIKPYDFSNFEAGAQITEDKNTIGLTCDLFALEAERMITTEIEFTQTVELDLDDEILDDQNINEEPIITEA